MESTQASITEEGDGLKTEHLLFTYDEEEKQRNEINAENARLISKFKYLVIPMSIFRLGLTGNETILFAFIDSWFTEEDQRFYFTNAQLGLLFNLSVQSVSIILKKLSEKKLIRLGYKRKSNGGQIRFVELMTSTKFKYQLKESLSSNLKKVEGNNNTIKNNNINIGKSNSYFIKPEQKTTQYERLDGTKYTDPN